jgi:DNA-binding CsgD family transcriptional regulator
MPRLSWSDQRAILEVLRDVYAQTELAPLREHMVCGAKRLVPADWGTFNEWLTPSLQVKSSISFPDVSVISGPHFQAFQAYFHQHPIARANRATGRATAQKISDYVGLRQLERTELYNEYYRVVGMRHQFTFSSGDDAMVQRWIALNRGKRDFSERDRTVLNALQPHYAQAYHNVGRLDVMQKAVKSLERVHETRGEAMAVVNAEGQIEWLSQQAASWLRESLGVDFDPGMQLPETIARWLRAQRETLRADKLMECDLPSLQLRTRSGAISIRCAAHDLSGNSTLLLCLAKPENQAPVCNLPQLTPRENEVLRWIAQGKSNPEIAGILGLSVRTVYKHVENIFPKIGVESRSAAMLRVLNSGRG